MTDSSRHDVSIEAPSATEYTRLLDSAQTTTYTNGMHIDQERSERVVSISTGHHPTVPLADLTNHIQHLLVFGTQQDDRPGSSHSIGHRAIPGEQDEDGRGLTVHKSKKRDLIAGALRFATDQWMENQGITNEMIHDTMNSDSDHSPPVIPTSPQPLVQPNDDSVKDVWDVAKNASVCAVLGLLSERRQGKVSMTADVDATLQRLALSTLEHGIKQSSAKDMIRQEMLFKPWLGDKSAIQWAVENDCTLFLNDEHVQTVIKQSWLYGDTEWKTNYNHPLQIWHTTHQQTSTTTTREDWKMIFTSQFIISYLARWAYPRYQCMIAFTTALIYLGFHLMTLNNVEYMEDHMQLFEYFYYILVTSDFVLEVWKVTANPIKALSRPSTYLTLPTATLLFTSLVVRILAFYTVDLQPKYHGFYLSFVLLAIATPLMLFRMFIWIDVLWWRVYKINHVVGRCIAQSIWVFAIGLVGLIGFWIGMSALQRDDVGPWQMLLYLVWGAVGSPKIDDTLYYQPLAGSFLLVGYLFVMIFLVSALLVASFVSTILSFTRSESSFGHLQQYIEAKRSARLASYGVFIPNVAIELVVAIIVYIAKKVKPGIKLVWLERLRQVVWFIIFSPIILVIALIELVYYLFYPWK